MKYQDCAEPLQAPDDDADDAATRGLPTPTSIRRPGLPPTISIISTKRSCCSKCCRAARTAATIFSRWQPHELSRAFRRPRTSKTARSQSPPMTLPIRTCATCLDTLAGTMTAVLEATRAAMDADRRPETGGGTRRERRRLAEAADRARRRGDQRRGRCGLALTPQAVVDRLMKR